jgi:hypothetical protein
MSSEYMYFIWIGKGWEDGNPSTIKQHLIGCYKNYEEAHAKLNDELKKTGVKGYLVKPELLEKTSGICDCCGEIESYDIFYPYNGFQISLYKCRPHVTKGVAKITII